MRSRRWGLALMLVLVAGCSRTSHSPVRTDAGAPGRIESTGQVPDALAAIEWFRAHPESLWIGRPFPGGSPLPREILRDILAREPERWGSGPFRTAAARSDAAPAGPRR